jgi:mono/diheme cytochrome c family protein
MKKLLVFLILILAYACSTYKGLPPLATDNGWKTKVIPPHPQQENGDPEAGYDYLVYGNYVGSGIPYNLAKRQFGKNPKNVLDREGINANINYQATVFPAKNGLMVANGNCFTCHAGSLNGQVVLGLGNSFSDFRSNFGLFANLASFGMSLKYGKNSLEWEAFEDMNYYLKASGKHIKTNQPGANPAAVLAEAIVRHRNPEDLTYVEEPYYEMPKYTIATDVPPLWNVKKKNALYYTAVGRGDFTKLLFQASYLGIEDSTAARQAVHNFKDVVAWMEQIEPPKYPYPIDQQLAEAGRPIFKEHCSGCHGTYGEKETYPNKVVSLDVVKTDPYYASYAVQAPIVEWYNKSWFATSSPRSYFEPEAGYIAPPLDGVWATAPYLHNGSVPTIEDLLNSKQRPKFWERSGRSSDYDPEKVGWNYTAKKNAKGKWTYDTTLPSYSNVGHYFGDKLTEEERKKVIEYLKTL